MPHPSQDESGSSGRSQQLARAEGSLSHYRFPRRSGIRTQTGVTTLSPPQEFAQALPVCSSYRLPNDEQASPAKVGYQRRRAPGAQPTQPARDPGKACTLDAAGRRPSWPNAGARCLHSHKNVRAASHEGGELWKTFNTTRSHVTHRDLSTPSVSQGWTRRIRKATA